MLEEVKGLLKELTSCGMIGANLAGAQEDDESSEKIEKGYGYKTSKSSKLPGDSRKSVLKKSIRAKLKNRK